MRSPRVWRLCSYWVRCPSWLLEFAVLNGPTRYRSERRSLFYQGAFAHPAVQKHEWALRKTAALARQLRMCISFQPWETDWLSERPAFRVPNALQHQWASRYRHAIGLQARPSPWMVRLCFQTQRYR